MDFLSVLLLAFASTACDSGDRRVDIWALPLDAEFFVPPSADYIRQNGVQISGVVEPAIHGLFDSSGPLSIAPDDERRRLRVMMTRRCDKRVLFVTAERKVIEGANLLNVSKGAADLAKSTIEKLVLKNAVPKKD